MPWQMPVIGSIHLSGLANRYHHLQNKQMGQIV
jgi:hypothetical protein